MDLIDKVIQFSGKSIPLKLAAKKMGKDYQFVKYGITEGVIPIGCALKMPGSSVHTIYVSPKLFYEYTGCIVTEEDIDEFNKNNK